MLRRRFLVRGTIVALFALMAIMIGVSCKPEPSAPVQVDNSKDFEFKEIDGGVEITKYLGTEKNVVIPSILGGKPVTSIGDLSFYNCPSLVQVTIPNGVKHIGLQAFLSCRCLTEVSMPSSVESIDSLVFFGCSALKVFTIPDGVKSIGSQAFSFSGLETIYIPKSVSNIGSIAFNGCENLIKIEVDPANATYRSSGNCIIEKESDIVLLGCKASVIPADVVGIGEMAFWHCGGLEGINIPANVVKIGRCAFEGCHCSSITVDPANSVFHVSGNCLIKTEDKVLLFAGENFVFPDDGSVTSIGESAFYGSGIGEIVIPNGVTSIGYFAFIHCDNLKSVSLPGTLESIGNQAFWNCGLESILIPAGVGYLGRSVFNRCSDLATIEVDPGNPVYHSQGNCLIDNTGTLLAGCKNSVIPTDGTVTAIGHDAFANCVNLDSVTIPASVSKMESSVFENWSSSQTIRFERTKEEVEYLMSGDGWSDYWNSGCSAQIIYAEPSSTCKVTIVGDGAESYVDKEVEPGTEYTIKPPENNPGPGYRLSYVSDGVENYSVGDKITINFNTMLTYHWLTVSNKASDYEWRELDDGTLEVTGYKGTGEFAEIPAEVDGKKVTTIGGDSFSNCNSLVGVAIPDGVTDIGPQAFSNCDNLELLSLPSTLATIDGSAFRSCKKLKKLTIPDGVQAIGSQAFSYTNIESLRIPKSVSNINPIAFNGCYNLVKIEVEPANATYRSSGNCIIEKESDIVLLGCKASEIPADVVGIGNWAFCDCLGLEEINIPANVVEIGQEAFEGCHCSSITVDPANSVFHDSGNCLIKTEDKVLILAGENFVIPDDGSVTTIGESAFEGSYGLTEVRIPDGVTSIGNFAFGYCRNLKSVSLPGTLESIGHQAFYNCGLESILIPPSVEHIADKSFGGCQDLASIEVEPGNPIYHSQGNCLIDNTGTLLAGCKNSVIPTDGTVVAIGYGAFANCGNLDSVTIPASVSKMGSSVFQNWSSSQTIRFEKTKDEVEYLMSGDGWDDNWNRRCSAQIIYAEPSSTCKVTIVGDGTESYVDKEVEPGTEYTIKPPECNPGPGYRFGYVSDGVENYSVGDKITINFNTTLTYNWLTVSYKASDYEWRGLDDGTLEVTGYKGTVEFAKIPAEVDGRKVASIGERAFSNCNSLVEVAIPDGVTNISREAFFNCDNLEVLSMPSTLATIDRGAFLFCGKLKNLTIPDGVQAIGGQAFSYTGLESLRIPKSVGSIGPIAFNGCDNLVGIEVDPENATYRSSGNCIIEKESDIVLLGCKASVIPADVVGIGNRAFSDCRGLEEINIPANVKEIGQGAFEGCHLANITVDPANSVFHDSGNCLIKTEDKVLIFAGENFVIPDDGSVTTIGKSAFEGSYGLTEVCIPDGVTSIGIRAFGYCRNLKSVSLPGTLESIGVQAFCYCGLESILIPPNVEHIDDMSFGGCQDLASIEVEPGNPIYHSQGNCLIDNTGTLLAGCKNSVIPTDGTVTSIGQRAFYETNIKEIAIPDSVASIGLVAFEDCTSLASITIPSSVEAIGSGAFSSWTSSQTINIDKTKAEVNALIENGQWSEIWNWNCQANIVYKGSPSN